MDEEKNIFIAEDNYEFCDLYRMALGAEGYQVHFAHAGKEALEKILAEHPDLIILDVMMPDMDGYEVCRKLREHPDFALTPIIMLTALSADEDKIKGYHVGADEYITKPFSLKVLKARVRSILEKSARKKAQVAQPVLHTAPPIVQVAQPIVIKEGPEVSPAKPVTPIKTLKPGEDPLEQLFGGAIPAGSNILVVGPLGSGKSFFARLFLSQGLRSNDKCMMICLDDDPSMVRKEIDSRYGLGLSACEGQDQIRFVDAYSWSGGRTASTERYAVKGTLELADLSQLISEAASDLGQTEQLKQGGRRVIDSISSLFLNFELPYVQRFIAYMARSGHFAGVSTIFVVEEGACNDQALNNIKYVMDAIFEFKAENQRFLGRAQSMKWATASSEWTDMTQT